MIRKLLFSLLFLVGFSQPAMSEVLIVTVNGVDYKVSPSTTQQVIVPKAEVVVPDPLPPVFLDVSADSDSVTCTVTGNPADQVPANLIAVILIKGGDVSKPQDELVEIAASTGHIVALGASTEFTVTPSNDDARIFTLVAISLQQVQQ